MQQDTSVKSAQRHPLTWVPTLYFAEGLPFAVVMIMTTIMYARLGVPTAEITAWTGLLGMAWGLKPFWSPFLELASSPKKIVVATQLIGGALLLGCAAVLNLPGFFLFSVSLLLVASYASATHDIAADGTYISNLSKESQALYSGWLGAFWNGGKLFVLSGLVVIAGLLEEKMPHQQAWALTMAIPGIILLGLGFYHIWAMPNHTTHDASEVSFASIWKTLKDVLGDFFKKPGVWFAICFIILFRAGEGLVQSVGRIFLTDDIAHGGLGMTTVQFGIAYGLWSTLAFIGGSIGGGYFAAWLGLKRTLFFLILMMNIPNLTFWYLGHVMPNPATDMTFISSMLCIEMFGFGFGFAGLTLYLMQVVAPGKYPTAHYAIGTAIMAQGLNIFTMISGTVKSWMDYKSFFVVGVLACIPVLLLSLIAKVPGKEKA